MALQATYPSRKYNVTQAFQRSLDSRYNNSYISRHNQVDCLAVFSLGTCFMNNNQQMTGRSSAQQRQRRLRRLRILGASSIILLISLLAVNIAWSIQPITLKFVVPSGEIAFWTSSASGGELSLIEEFEAKNPRIQIEVVPGSSKTNGLQATYEAAFEAGVPYDLVYMDSIWTEPFAKNSQGKSRGWLKNLSRDFPDARKMFLPEALTSEGNQDELYRIPFVVDLGVVYRRSDLVENAPRTFKELINLSREKQIIPTLQNPSGDRNELNDGYLWGYIWQGYRYEGLVVNFFEVLKGLGGNWYFNPETNRVHLDEVPAREAVKLLLNMVYDPEQRVSSPLVSTYSERESIDEFNKGHAIFLRGWSNAWQDISGGPMSGKVEIQPVVSGDGNSSHPCIGGWGFGVAQRSRHPSEAVEAIKFFTSTEAQRKFVLKTGYLPSREAVWNDPRLPSNYREHFSKMKEILKSSASRPATPLYDEAAGVLKQNLGEALAGRYLTEALSETLDASVKGLVEQQSSKAFADQLVKRVRNAIENTSEKSMQNAASQTERCTQLVETKSSLSEDCAPV